MKIKPEPFSIDHLLLGGFVYDVGQLRPEQKEELNSRHAKGELNKYFIPYPQRTVTERFRMVTAWAHPNWVGQYQFHHYSVDLYSAATYEFS